MPRGLDCFFLTLSTCKLEFAVRKQPITSQAVETNLVFELFGPRNVGERSERESITNLDSRHGYSSEGVDD